MLKNNYPGLFIAFEGIDGSGKTTQAELLLKFLKSNKISTAYISFPRYDDSLWGKMVKRYLRGDFGEVGEVDPYLVSMLYAGDRLTAAPQIKRWLTDGRIVVCNRYVGSNMAHMGGKFKVQSSKFKFIKWLEELEYRENKIPKEDLVILLQVPPEVSRELMAGEKLDIHEKDLKYQKEVLRVYDYVARQRKNWERIDCTASGKILRPEEIHKKVLEVLKKWKILPESTSQFVLRLSSTDIVIDADEGIKGIKR